MKAKLQRLAALGTALALSAGPVLAQTAQPQPDVAEVVTYMLGAIATIVLIGNAKLLIRTAGAIFSWVGRMIR